jgi:hypothetical protein
MDNPAYQTYMDLLSSEGFDHSITYVPNDVAFGWVDDPIAVQETLATFDIKNFSDTPAAGYADDELPDHCYLWDFAKMVTGDNLPPRNQGQVGSCFPAGTKIRMADGSYKNIEDIKLRDKVLTAEGNIGKVTTCFLREENKSLLSFKCHGHYGLQATAEHPILTQRGYVRMDELKIGDYVSCPKYIPENKTSIKTQDYASWNVKITRKEICRVSGSVMGRKKSVIQISPMPEEIELTEDFGRLIGLFLAEGNTDKNKVCWTFNIDEKDTLAKDVVDILKNQLNASARIREIPEKNTCKVILHGREWSNLFEKLCGNGSGNKAIHKDLLCGPLKFLKETFRGWMDGDGHVSSAKKCIQGVTVSHELALNMFDITNKLGLSPVIRKSDPKVSHGVKSRRRRYDLIISTGGGLNKPQQDENRQWRKITYLGETKYTGEVFNFEVEGDNSYVVEGIGVHNCVAFGCCSAIEYTMCAEIAQGDAEEFKPLVQEIVYGGSRVEIGNGRLGRGDGSIGAWGADFVRKYGIINRGTFLNGKYNLEKYSESLCRQWGASGVPNDLEPLVKEHPVKYTTQISDWKSAKKSLVQGYGISVASNQGFTTSRNSKGVCKPSGSWAHQMAIIGYATIDGEEHGFILNSWGTYMGTSNIGPGEPSPAGFYAHWSVIDKMLKQDDSFCYSAVQGFPLRKLRWKI